MLSEKSSTILRDLGFAARSLRRTPAFTVIAVLTLGLGIGANTSAFSVLNEVFFRALPYPDSGQLDRIYRKTPQNARGGVSPADWLDLQSELKGYGEVTAYALTEMSLSAPGEPAEVAAGLRVAGNFFATLGVEPERGRGFRPEEAILGNHHVLVVSQKYWQSRFGGDAKILGRKVRVDGEPYEIVGVMPERVEDWRHLGAFDLYRPLGLTEEEKSDRGSTSVRLMGRRSANITAKQGAELLAAFGRRLATAYPAAHAGTSWRSLAVHKAVAPDNGPVIFGMLIGLSLFVLLIACSNLANLLLARTMARARELAVRTALGASRARLLRPLFLESLVLALAGGVAAVFFSFWTNDWLRSAGIEGGGFNTDWRVLSWAFAASLFTVIAFGVGPALFAMRLDPNRTLKAGSRGTTGDRGHQRFRQLLIVGQFAFAMILLAGAALFVRGIYELNQSHHGWQSDRLVTGSLLLPEGTYSDAKQIAEFQRLALERLEALPGVGSASFSYAMPYFGLAEPRKYVVAGRETPEPGHEPVAVINGVSPHYFETVGTQLVAGRAFDERDRLDAPKVFVINQAMAHGLFGDESPLGRRIGRSVAESGGTRSDTSVEWGEIVGVVGDIESIYPEKTAVPFQLYQPMAQEPRPANEIAIRSTAALPPNASSGLVESIRRAMAALDPDLPVRLLQPAETTIAKANFQWGVLGTFGIARLLAGAFPGMHANSAAVLLGVTLLLAAVALFASWVPARAAARIDPTETLRME